MKKSDKVSLIVIVLLVIVPPIIILCCFAHGISGILLGVLAFAYSAAVAYGIYELAKDHIFKSENPWINLLKYILFMLIPWVTIMGGLTYVGLQLEEKYTDNQRTLEIKNHVIESAISIQSKLSSIDSLISTYREMDTCVEVHAISQYSIPMTGARSDRLKKKIKMYNDVYNKLKIERDNYQYVNKQDLTKQEMLLWFDNDTISPLKNGEFKSLLPAKNEVSVNYDEHKLSTFSDLEKVVDYISTYFTRNGITFWSSGIEKLEKTINAVKDARILVFVHFEYMIHPCIEAHGFIGGAIRANLRLWNFEDNMLVDTMKVYAQNSERITSTSVILNEDEVHADLMQNLYEQIQYKLSQKYFQ